MKYVSRFLRALAEPVPMRFLVLRFLDRRFNLVDYPAKLNIGSLDRANYGFGLLHAARLAQRLGHTRIAALEFGVAGGRGLIAMEEHAEHVRSHTGVAVSVYGLDSGAGMPPPRDYRDTPYLLESGNQKMQPDMLLPRLRHAKLVLGALEDTVPEFCENQRPDPIGFMAFDLGYYSSTVAALRIFDAPQHYFLPRVICFVNDTGGGIDWALNEFIGGYLAVEEFNRRNRDIKLARVAGLRFADRQIPRLWHEQTYMAHLFGHPDYARPINPSAELPLH